MNNPELIAILFIGTILMTLLIAIQMRWYGIEPWKSIVVAVVLVIVGAFGSRVWYFVENGEFRGRSLYGAIFLSPIAYIPIAFVLRIPYMRILDFCAPAGCLTLALSKLQCMRDGCCTGMVLYVDENFDYVKFPSQIVEMGTFIAIAVILFYLSSRPRCRGRIFPMFLLLYGASRFFLDFLRGGTVPYALGLSAGSFWSLIAGVIGLIVLIIMKLRELYSQKA